MLADPARHFDARRQFRRAVAESAPRRGSRRRSGTLSELRREPAAGVQAGNGAVRRQHDSARIAASSDLLNANYTFVNERLARHYGIPGIYGSRFRRVTLPNHDQRGGLLAQGALLATTSYPDRTSPVLRGKWLLNNIFGLPVPPPPPGVDTNLGDQARRAAANDSRAAGAASAESLVQQLSFGDRSARLRAREFRRHRRLADGGRDRASRSTRAAPPRAARRSTGCPDCGRCCSSSPSSFPARSPKSFWPTRSAGGSSTTIGRRCARSSATRRRTTIAGRRSFWGL